jgi:hypothetical protein
MSMMPEQGNSILSKVEKGKVEVRPSEPVYLKMIMRKPILSFFKAICD